MKITAIEIENIKSFQNLPKTNVSESINIFIGPNNAGKTTILKSIFLMQNDSFNDDDITKGHSSGNVYIYYDGEHLSLIMQKVFEDVVEKYKVNIDSAGNIRRYLLTSDSAWGVREINKVPEMEPDNLIYPYLSRRKGVSYSSPLNEANTNIVTGDLTGLYLKIDRLISEFPEDNEKFHQACKDVLGFRVHSKTTKGVKVSSYYIDRNTSIPIDAMGEGVANILGLIVQLCYVNDDRIFLIEEIENDIHPKALKSLLKLIAEKARTNQFFISTHSNIVMKYLGAEPNSKIFNVTNDLNDVAKKNLLLSQIKEIANSPDERRQVLEDLGYEFFDFDLWEYWLFLEESSAEILIRDYFISWFTKLSPTKIRTFSAGGVAKLKSRFEDFNKLFVFLHLQPTYKNKVWVLIDDGDREKDILKDFNKAYVNDKNGWSTDNFRQFDKHDFEEYYPAEFQDKVKVTLAIANSEEKRKAKKALLDEVKAWIKKDENTAKTEFEKSAGNVISHLKFIEERING
jgi:predicted ATPase